MSLPIPNLDDRTFDDLVAEGIAMIPIHAPEWTNHNPSDPGITLVELLAYVTEILIYRLNRVDRESKLGFLRLLRGEVKASGTDDSSSTAADVDAAIRDAVVELGRSERAVTKADFEVLSRNAAASEAVYGESARSVRTFCLVGRSIEKTERGFRVLERSDNFTVIVVPPTDAFSGLSEGILAKIRDELLPMCLLGTRLQVCGTVYVTIAISALIHTHMVWHDADEWRRAAQLRLDAYFTPHPGAGLTDSGWPFGRHVYLSDVEEALLQIAGVDSVEDVRMVRLSMEREEVFTDAAIIGVQTGVFSVVGMSTRIGADRDLGLDRLMRTETGQLSGITLRPYELVKVVVAPDGLRVVEQPTRSQ